MELAKKDIKRSRIIIFLSSLFVIVFLLVAIVLFMEEEYLFVLAAILLAGIGFAISLYASLRQSDAKKAIELIRAMTLEGERWRSLSGVSTLMGWSERETKKFIKKCESLGYIR